MATFDKTPDGRLLRVVSEGDKHIVLPSGIWRIGPSGYIQRPFLGQGNQCIESVVIPEGVTEIGAYALYDLPNLKSVTLPSTLKKIEGSAFGACGALEEIHFPEGLETILNGAFFGCGKLKRVHLPGSLKTLGDQAFAYCTGLQEVSGLRRELLKNAGIFTGCDGLKNEAGFVIVENILYGYVGEATEVVIPDTVDRIGGAVFAGNDKITAVTIPDTVTELGESMFRNCKALTSVKLPKDLKEISRGCFDGCLGFTRFEVPSGIKKIQPAAFSNCTNLTEVILPDGLKTIAGGAFSNCNGLEEIRIPDSVTELEGFSNCEKLSKINMPAKLKKIGNFEGCKKITALILKQGVELPYFGFGKKILIHHQAMYESPWKVREQSLRLWCDTPVVVAVGKEDQVEYKILLCEKFEKLVAFDKKGNLNWKTYDALLSGNDLKLAVPYASLAMLYRLRWPVELEENRKKLFVEQVTKDIKKLAPYVNLVPEDGLIAVLEQIGALTEKNKKTLLPLMGIGEAPAPKKKAEKKPKEATPEGVKTPAQIRKEWGTKKLADGTLWLTSYKGTDTVVEIPAVIGKDAVTVVGNECFSCGRWGRATPEQLTVRKQITSVVIPEGITQIGEDAFRECIGLTTVTFPSTLQSIEASAFFGCINLEAAELPDGVKTIGAHAFQKCTKLSRVRVPNTVELNHGSFNNCPGLADDNGFVIVTDVLYGCFKGGDLVIPNTVKSMSSSAIDGLQDLTSVVFPEGLTNLPRYSIKNCPNLTAITIPSSVTKIAYEALPYMKATIYGYTGSAAEELCNSSYGNLTFSSTGVLEKGDFVVEDGVLVEYNGNDEVVTIPQGVRTIGNRQKSYSVVGAFEGKTTLRHVIIPEGVTRIQRNAFYRCDNLETIEFPSSIEKVEYCAISLTKWYQNRTSGPVYVGKVLLNYVPYDNKEQEPAVLEIPEGISVIADDAIQSRFCGKKIVLPSTLERICNGAFRYSDIEEMVVPATLTEVEDYAFENTTINRCSGGVLHKKDKLPARFKIFYTGDPEDTAWVTLYQAEQSWRKAVRERMESNPEYVAPAMERMAQLINEMDVLDKGAGNRAAAFAQELCKTAMGAPVKALYEALKAKNHPMAKKLEADADFMDCIEGGKQEDLSLLHPVEAKVVQALKPTPAFDRVMNRIIETVPYAGSEELCAPRVLAFIIYEYIRQYNPDDMKFISMYENDCTAYEWSEVADEAAAALDQAKLVEVLRQLAERYEGEYYLPYARYADDKTTVSILSQMREWDHWGKYAATGRKYIMIARSGLLLNNTKAAMIHMDKVGKLGIYAQMRGTDAATLRDTVLADFGFDENREIRYDLGGNSVVISMDAELNLTIFDTNVGKIVKSIPKKGADAALHEKAKTAFSDLKKNIKKVLTNRKHLLFADFLSGAKKEADAWKKAYMNNPVLNSVARLIVWEQEGKTFTLTLQGAIDSNGDSYALTDAPVGVAHPIEMRSELDAWQRYFTEHGLKQPFEQVWEPAYNADDIKPDRYDGCKLNVYRLANKEAHGIRVWGLQAYSEEYGFELNDCKMEQEGSEWRFINGITDDAQFSLGKFTFDKLTRYVNHIVYLFDKWTITDRLLKDDTSVESMLNAFTAAQIREFVKLTTEKDCTNATAMLLEYQNNHFADVDPLAEFTLDL